MPNKKLDVELLSKIVYTLYLNGIKKVFKNMIQIQIISKLSIYNKIKIIDHTDIL